VVERRWIGGSCPNINFMPTKNEIWSAKIAHLVRHAAQFGTMTGSVAIDMGRVRQRKREMVEAEIADHVHNYKTSGTELIMGSGTFVAPKTLQVLLNDGDAAPGRRPSLHQRRNALGSSRHSRPRRGPTDDQYRGARTRLRTAPSHRARRLRRSRNGTGVSSLRERTPACSSPIPAVLGTRPAATRMSVPSILRSPEVVRTSRVT
jgi:hypothetical protein